MKILVITSLYPDSSILKTTSAVHELVREWTEEHEVVCFKEEWISTVLNPFKRKKMQERGYDISLRQ